MHFLTDLEAGSPRRRCQERWFPPRPLSLASPLVLSGLPSVHVCVFTSFYKNTSYGELGPTPVTSFDLNYLFKDPLSK